MAKVPISSGMGLVEPQARIRHLASYGNLVEIDPNIPAKRYYRSGMEMVRMAKVYLSEGNLENAYILFFKFMTLFLEKIQKHPEYKTVPAAVKKPNQDKLKEVLPICEELKTKLMARYQKEFTQFLAERAKDAEKAKQAIQKTERKDTPQPSGRGEAPTPSTNFTLPTAPDLNLLDQVVYPNDFPTGPNKSSEGLLMPDNNKKPNFDRNLKPDTLIEGNLRTVVVPHDTMSQFLSIAAKNTAQNVETCGILAGKLSQNRLLITHVIVPKQKGTPDSCTTTNEEEIFDVQDQLNLITLGWIHTHPSQTAFLSSVDLHTHCSYQLMMPEAIAIVCAPKYQTTGFFCLTQNYGLDYIAQCRQSGFHPHPNDPQLFVEASHVLIERTNIEVINLR